MEKTIDNIIIRIFTIKTLIIISALIFPIFALKIIGNENHVDPLIVYVFLSIGVIAGILTLKKSLETTFIPYLFLQLIIIAIFLDTKITTFTGINFKIYILVFGIAFLTAIYYMYKDFNYLWKNFLVFRLLLIFFLINIFYFLFYHSDFRQWYSTYMDIWLASPAIRELFIKNGIAVFTKSFAETEYVGMYLGSLVPVICFTVAVMTFNNIKNPDEITDRLLYIIKIITISFIAYLILAFVFVIIGISTIGFHHGRLWGDFLGFGHSFAIYLSYYLLLLIGLKYFMNTNIIPLEYKIYEKLVNFLILIFSMLIILQINKTALISLTLAILTFVIIGFFLGIKINLFEKIHTSLKFSRKELFKKTALFASLIILILLIIANYDSITIFINETINRVMLRFSTFTTLNSRTVLWEYFIEYWYDNLTITKILFGSGIDSSREVAFMLSAMLAGDIRMFSSPLVHVHNLYLEMFYDYGLVALLYFGSIIYILLDNIKLILSKTNNNIKLFSLLSLSIITFFLLFSLTEILRIPIAIILFSMLGFLESIKWSLIKNQEKI